MRKRRLSLMIVLLLFFLLAILSAPALAKHESEVVAVIDGQGAEGVNVSIDPIGGITLAYMIKDSRNGWQITLSYSYRLFSDSKDSKVSISFKKDW